MQFTTGAADSRHSRIRLLRVEEDPRDALLIREYLLEFDHTMQVLRARNLNEPAPMLGDPAVEAISLVREDATFSFVLPPLAGANADGRGVA